MKIKDLNEDQKRLGTKLHAMCRSAGYDFDDFVAVENGNYYYIKSDIIGLRNECDLFVVYLSESGVYSIERDCLTCGFSERVDSSAGMSQTEIKAWLKRELDRSYLISAGAFELDHECEEV